MSYAPPAISASGLTVSTYQDYLQYLMTSYQTIFGQSVSLDVATPDYQMLSTFALMYSDAAAGLKLVYQNRGPLTAVGAGLDGIGQWLGFPRLGATPSTVALTLTGAINTTITNGQALDSNGITWALPGVVIIGSTGSTISVATATTTGPITADVGTIATIVTPQAGWTSVTNTSPAVLGSANESDGLYRQRLLASVQGPSLSPIDAVRATVAAVSGVTRSLVLENYTGSIDAYGNPGHSISAVVEGGGDSTIAQAIYLKKTPGAFTNGGSNPTTINVLSSASNSQTPISFQRPTYVPVYVTVNVKPFSTFTSATATAIQAAVFTFLNALDIGQSVYMGELFGVVQSVNANPLSPDFVTRSIFLGTTASPATSNDVTLQYFQVSQGLLNNISVLTVA